MNSNETSDNDITPHFVCKSEYTYSAFSKHAFSVLTFSHFRQSQANLTTMTTYNRIISIFCLIALIVGRCQGFSQSSFIGNSRSLAIVRSSSSLQMFFGAKKDDGKPGDYLCPDCGYVFTKGPEAWSKLPEDYRCPPCGAPKFRFKKVPKGSQSGKVEVKKNWFGK